MFVLLRIPRWPFQSARRYDEELPTPAAPSPIIDEGVWDVLHQYFGEGCARPWKSALFQFRPWGGEDWVEFVVPPTILEDEGWTVFHEHLQEDYESPFVGDREWAQVVPGDEGEWLIARPWLDLYKPRVLEVGEDWVEPLVVVVVGDEGEWLIARPISSVFYRRAMLAEEDRVEPAAPTAAPKRQILLLGKDPGRLAPGL